MPENPWELLAKSQRAAAHLLADTLRGLVDLGKAGVTRPEEAVKQVASMASAMGDLVSTTAMPLEYFLESQRQLAESLNAFAVLQRQLAEVVEGAAASHATMVQALEMMTHPVVSVAQSLRHQDEDTEA